MLAKKKNSRKMSLLKLKDESYSWGIRKGLTIKALLIICSFEKDALHMYVNMVLNGRVVISGKLALYTFCACSVELLVTILR